MLAQLQASFKAMLVGGKTNFLFKKFTIISKQSIAIYQNNYQEIHIAALKDTYSTVYYVTGETNFRQLAKHYLQQHPSTTGDLNDYGQYFAEFIASILHKLPDNLAYLADVARFDWAYFTVLTADYQGNNALNQLATWPVSQQEQAIAIAHPVCQLISSPHPISQIWQLSLGDIEQVNLDSGAEYLLISRPQQQMTVNILSKQEYDFLQTWLSGHPLIYVINTIFDENNVSQLPLLFAKLQQWSAIVELRSA